MHHLAGLHEDPARLPVGEDFQDMIAPSHTSELNEIGQPYVPDRPRKIPHGSQAAKAAVPRRPFIAIPHGFDEQELPSSGEGHPILTVLGRSRVKPAAFPAQHLEKIRLTRRPLQPGMNNLAGLHNDYSRSLNGFYLDPLIHLRQAAELDEVGQGQSVHGSRKIEIDWGVQAHFPTLNPDRNLPVLPAGVVVMKRSTA
jgi:hypothetical protein